MGDDSRGTKRLRAQLKELKKEAERGFMAAERECGDTVSVFSEDEDVEDGVNIWGRIIGEKVRSLENSHEKGSHSAVESTHREPVNHRDMMKRPEEERIKCQEGMQKEFKDFEKRGVWKVI